MTSASTNTRAFPFWALAATVLAGVALVGYSIWSAASSFPPGSSLTYGDLTVAGDPGSYCNYNGCVDMAFTAPPEEVLGVPSGEKFVFDYGGWLAYGIEARAFPVDRNDQVEYYPEGGQRLSVGRGPGGTTLTAELPPGKRYLVEVLLRAPPGSASYYFQVGVREPS